MALASLCPLIFLGDADCLILWVASCRVHGLSFGVYFFLDPPFATACVSLDYLIQDSSLGFLMSSWLSISLLNPLFIYIDDRLSFKSTNHNFPSLSLDIVRRTDRQTGRYRHHSFVALEIELGASCMLGKQSITKLYSQCILGICTDL